MQILCPDAIRSHKKHIMCRYTAYHNLDTKCKALIKSSSSANITWRTDCQIHGNQLAGNQRLCRLKEFFAKRFFSKLKFWPQINNKSFPGMPVTVNQHEISAERICNYFMKLLKRVLLLGDPNCEATQWLRESYC